MPNDAFDLGAKVLKDTSLRDDQMFSYDAKVSNERGRVDLPPQSTSLYFLPSEGILKLNV